MSEFDEEINNGDKYLENDRCKITIVDSDETSNIERVKQTINMTNNMQLEKDKFNIIIINNEKSNENDEDCERQAINIPNGCESTENLFEKDKFNILIVNNSNEIYNDIELLLTEHAADFCTININGSNIEQFSQKLFSYDYTRKTIPMCTDKLGYYDDEFMNMMIILEPRNLLQFKIYHYKLYPTDSNFHPTIIHDKNDMKYSGPKPPNMKIIIQEHDVQVLTYY